MITKPITKEEAYQIFKREAVLIGFDNGVPASKAKFYFGKRSFRTRPKGWKTGSL